MNMPGRKYSASSSKYRYGFNGKELDNEVVQYDYGFRIYDPRLVRFKSVDPLTKEYPWYTPYQFAGNTPIQAIDLDGNEEVHYTLTLNKNGSTSLIQTSIKYTNKVPLWLRIICLGAGKSEYKIPPRAVVDYENKKYYIGFAGSYGRGNENGMALFNEFKKNPEASFFPEMFLDEDKSYSVEAFSIAVQMQNNTAMYGPLTEKAWYTRTLENAKTSTVYRTQGGELPNASRSRISFAKNGEINIAGNEMLYVTLNDKAHQVYFYQKRGGSEKGSQIVSFQIPQSLADEIVANGVPQAQGKANPGSPQLSDPTKSNSAYGLPKAYIDKLRQQAITGSGKVETPK
jgi:RHS repeat-associated protein